MHLLQVFSNNLRKYRSALGMSQEAFANKAGLHRTGECAFRTGPPESGRKKTVCG